MTHMKRTVQRDQRGLVSIVVTMIMMVIMSLIVIGFARISRRELRQGLDRQLVSQANYAAETGINDAQSYLRGGGTLTGTAATVCNSYANNPGGLPPGKTEQVGSATVTTSCVLVDSTTQELVYDNVGTDSEVVFPLRSADNAAINRIFISWEGGGGGNFDSSTCQGNSVQLENGLVAGTPGSWTCPVGGLKFDVLPINSSGDVRRSVLLDGNVGGITMPRPNASVPRVSISNGMQYTAGCAAARTPRSCSIYFEVSGRSEYYVRIRPIYRSADLYVQARRGDGSTVNNIVNLTGAQALIDSTGRASDVLKRLVVRVPTCPSGLECGKRPASSGTALQLAETLCKRYGVIPPSTINVESSNPQCALP